MISFTVICPECKQHIEARRSGYVATEAANAQLKPVVIERDSLRVKVRELEAEVLRLQTIIDSRPAINAALPESYIQWSNGIYQLELARAMGKAS